MSLQVGDAQAQDIPALAAIYDHQVLHGFGTFEEVPQGADAFRAKWESVRELGLPFIVARDGAEIAGYAHASPFRPRSGYRFTIEDSIYVRHDMHGRGVGCHGRAAGDRRDRGQPEHRFHRRARQVRVRACRHDPWRGVQAGAVGRPCLHAQGAEWRDRDAADGTWRLDFRLKPSLKKKEAARLSPGGPS
jgi:hypothetical protein